jgi:hypothetical protein
MCTIEGLLSGDSISNGLVLYVAVNSAGRVELYLTTPDGWQEMKVGNLTVCVISCGMLSEVKRLTDGVSSDVTKSD